MLKERRKTPRQSVEIIRTKWPRVRDVTESYGKQLYLVDPRPHSARRYFTDQNEAVGYANYIASERERKGVEALTLPTDLRVMAQECIEKLSPYGKSLREAVDHYVAWLKEGERKSKSLMVEECVAQYLSQREKDFHSGIIAERTFHSLRRVVAAFRSACGGFHILEVNRRKVEEYLDRIAAPVSKKQARVILSGFFNFCRGMEWLEVNPCTAIRVREQKRGEVSVLTVEQATKLLQAAKASRYADEMVPYIGLGLFAGLRPDEARQIDWAQIHFDTETVEVLGRTSKTRQSRFVKMESALVAWLTPHRKSAGALTDKNFRRKWDEVRNAAGFKGRANKKNPGTENLEDWSPDVMRHTYASYWLALHNDRPHLAELMGNSVDVIRKHYRRPILPREADKYWLKKPV